MSFALHPAGTQVLVDGVPVAWTAGAVALAPGRHRVDALAPEDSGYASRAFVIDVAPDMPPVRRSLQRLARLRVEAPAGYEVRLDGSPLAPAAERGLTQALTTDVHAGSHHVSAESWRGRLLRADIELWPGRQGEVRLRPPSLAPGLVFAVAGLAGLAVGAALVGLHGTCAVPGCENIYDFSWSHDAATLQPPWTGFLILGIGGAELLAGTIWFAVNAAHHPRLRPREARARAPRLYPAGAAPVLQGRF